MQLLHWDVGSLAYSWWRILELDWLTPFSLRRASNMNRMVQEALKYLQEVRNLRLLLGYSPDCSSYPEYCVADSASSSTCWRPTRSRGGPWMLPWGWQLMVSTCTGTGSRSMWTEGTCLLSWEASGPSWWGGDTPGAAWDSMPIKQPRTGCPRRRTSLSATCVGLTWMPMKCRRCSFGSILQLRSSVST